MHARKFSNTYRTSYLKGLLKYRGVKPDSRDPPVPGDVVFILDKTSATRHGFKVRAVKAIDRQDVKILYKPGSSTKPKTIVHPLQQVEVLVRQADAKETLDFDNFPGSEN